MGKMKVRRMKITAGPTLLHLHPCTCTQQRIESGVPSKNAALAAVQTRYSTRRDLFLVVVIVVALIGSRSARSARNAQSQTDLPSAPGDLCPKYLPSFQWQAARMQAVAPGCRGLLQKLSLSRDDWVMGSDGSGGACMRLDRAPRDCRSLKLFCSGDSSFRLSFFFTAASRFCTFLRVFLCFSLPPASSSFFDCIVPGVTRLLCLIDPALFLAVPCSTPVSLHRIFRSVAAYMS